jgi:hypothetical protein
VSARHVERDAAKSCSGFGREGSPRWPGADDIGSVMALTRTLRSRLKVVGSRVGP